MLRCPHLSVFLNRIFFFYTSFVHISPETSCFPHMNILCMTTLCSPLFLSSLIVFHRDLFQSVGRNWVHDCGWLCCCGWQSSWAASCRCHPQVLSLLNKLSLLLPLLPFIHLSPSHQGRGRRTPTSSIDSSYLSSWPSLITTMHVVCGEPSRMPLLYSSSYPSVCLIENVQFSPARL